MEFDWPAEMVAVSLKRPALPYSILVSNSVTGNRKRHHTPTSRSRSRPPGLGAASDRQWSPTRQRPKDERPRHFGSTVRVDAGGCGDDFRNHVLLHDGAGSQSRCPQETVQGLARSRLGRPVDHWRGSSTGSPICISDGLHARYGFDVPSKNESRYLQRD